MYRMIIDVEGTRNKMVYDFGACVMDSHGNIVREYRALVCEVWHGMADEMVTAHYADKLPTLYYPALSACKVEILPLCIIRGDVLEMIAEYNISQVWAYNASYDRDALNLTTDRVSNGLLFNFMPEGITWHCIHTLASAKICNKRKFYKWAFKHQAQAVKPETQNLATGAQVVYQFLTDNPNFIEEHTALSDARIESAILWHVLSKKTKYKPYSKPAPGAWRIPQAGWREYLDSQTN